MRISESRKVREINSLTERTEGDAARRFTRIALIALAAAAWELKGFRVS